jgi:TPR repeat protein
MRQSFSLFCVALLLPFTGCGDKKAEALEGLKAHKRTRSCKNFSLKAVPDKSGFFSYTCQHPKGVACYGTISDDRGGGWNVAAKCDPLPKTEPTDPHEKLEFHCEKGNVDKCYALGMAHQKREVANPDLAYARKLFHKACEKKVWNACAALGFLNLRKLGGSLDLVEAERVLQLACDGGVVRGCTNLAHVHVQNRKWDLAREVFKSACTKNDLKACNGYGARLKSKLGRGRPDRKFARSVFLKNCTAGFMNSCTNYAVMLREGEGGKKNYTDAKRYFAKACKGNDQPGCFNLKQMK